MKRFESALIHGGMERVGVFEIDEVLPFIVDHKGCLDSKRMYDGHEVKMWSLRYHAFKKSLKCMGCGIEGRYFALERYVKRQPGDDRFHFNLYAKLDNGDEVLITKDHIIPKSKGGRESKDNMQTMCKVCNEMKMDKVA